MCARHHARPPNAWAFAGNRKRRQRARIAALEETAEAARKADRERKKRSRSEKSRFEADDIGSVDEQEEKDYDISFRQDDLNCEKRSNCWCVGYADLQQSCEMRVKSNPR